MEALHVTFTLLVWSSLTFTYGQDICSPKSCHLNNVVVQSPINPELKKEVFLGFVLPVHRYDPESGDPCRTISQRDILHMEAFLWALDTHDSRWNVTSANKLRGIVFDSCGSGDRFYTEMFDFMHCTPTADVAKPNVIAFLGYDEADVTSRGVRLFDRANTVFLTVSPYSPELGPRSKHPMFYRLTPSLDQEVGAIVDILNQLQWKNVHVTYVDDEYGRSAFETFKAKADQTGIFIDMVLPISSRADSSSIRTSVHRLSRNEAGFITGVVVFSYGRQKVIIQEALNTDYVVVTSGNSDDYLQSMHSKGSKGIILRLPPREQYNDSIAAFSRDISQLTWNRTHIINPWFENYYKLKYKCDWPGTRVAEYNVTCDVIKKLGAVSVSPTPTALIIEAVDIAVGAFQKAAEGCPQSPTNCPLFYDYQQLKLNFKKEFHNKINEGNSMDSSTNGPAEWTYDVFTTEFSNDRKLVYREVGTIQPNSKETSASTIQRLGALFEMKTGPPVQQTHGGNMVARTDYGNRWDRLDQAWVIVIGILACLGIVLVIVIAVITVILYIKNTRISYLWLYGVLLFGALIGYLTLFAFIPVPATATCGITRFGIGLSYGICISVMIVFALIMFKKLESSASSLALRIFIYVVLILLIVIEVAILVMWFILVPPGEQYRMGNHGTMLWGCRDHIWPLFMLTNFENHLLALIYIMVLLLILLILGIMIFCSNRRKLQLAEQVEAKAIFVAGVGCALIWIAWALVGGLLKDHSYAHEFADAALAFGLWLILTLLLTLLLVQLVYMWRASQGKLHKRLDEKSHKISGVENHMMVGRSLNEETVTSHEVGRPITILDNDHAHEVEMHRREDWPNHAEKANGNVVVTSKHTKTEVHTDHVDHKDRHNNHRETDRYAAHMGHAKLSGTSDYLPHDQHHHSIANQPGGTSFCSECGYAIDPNALHLVHPRSERNVYSPSSHNTSVFFSETSGKLVNGDTSLVHSDTPTYTAQEPSVMYTKGSRSLYSSPAVYYSRRPESIASNQRFVKVSRDLTGRPPSRYGMSFSEFDRVRYPSTRSFRRAKSEEHLGAL